MGHEVLISYSSHDKLQADAICNRLSKGISVPFCPQGWQDMSVTVEIDKIIFG